MDTDRNAPGSPVPGWYPDPTDAGVVRWWDGRAWSENTAPRTAYDAVSPSPTGPPPEKRRIRKRWLIPLVVIGTLGTLGGIGAALNSNQASYADVGDCIQGDRFSSDERVHLRTVACTDPAAVLQVGAKLDDAESPCPTEDYVKYYEKGPTSDDFSLCLVYHVNKDDCILDSDDEVKRIDCALGPGEHRLKIADVFRGVAEPARCPDRIALTYPQPPMTICVRLL